MGRTWRSPRAPEPEPQAPSGAEAGEQDLVGNSELQQRMRTQIAGVEDHNAVEGPVTTTDPEVVRGGERLAPEGRWDGAAILARWSQLDGSSATHTSLDSRRCGAQAVVAAHVSSGAAAVARAAASAKRAIPRIADPDARLLAQRHEDALDDLSRLSSLEYWTYGDLNELTETMYLIANEGSTFEGGEGGTDLDELDRIDDLGVPAGGEVPREGLAGALDALGMGSLMPEMPGTRAREGRAALDGLPDSGHHNGPRYMRDLVVRLSLYRNVALVIGTSGTWTRRPDGSRNPEDVFPERVSEDEVPSVLGSHELDATAGIEHNTIGHGVTLGVDGAGQVYLYDPWPREGSQRLVWPDAAIEEYFRGDWEIMSRVAAADGASRLGSSPD